MEELKGQVWPVLPGEFQDGVMERARKIVSETPLVAFEDFGKIPRLSRECTITEKIDGTNAQIFIGESGEFLTGSRNRWITPEDDNYGFSRWAHENRADIERLGPGRHFGEWWGQGIQRRYGQVTKRFSLFAVHRWTDPMLRPLCCDVVPILYQGVFSESVIDGLIRDLRAVGSATAPGFMNPEGIIIWHATGRLYFKKTLDKDEEPKGKAQPERMAA